ncbi:protein disulfide-isomerase A4-like [Tachypleus tridentatus]|uniref:protein disulfide-isomerase A4-like n=1 Tax=Tachypleus tridentatus TaxID=6853 RepID=UPI003FD0E59D
MYLSVFKRVLLLMFPLSLLYQTCMLEDVVVNEQPLENEDDIPTIEGFGGDVKITEDDDVLVLNNDNFDLVVYPKDIILVEFYAPWCGHCKSLAPEYAKAAKKLKEEAPPIPLAKVDATAETDLASRFEITGYPTLLIFRKGKESKYEGPRSAMGIVEYMKEQADPNWKPPPETVVTLTSENFTSVVNKADLILVEFYAPWCGHCKKLAPEYERAAQVLKENVPPITLAKIDATSEKELSDVYKVSGYPTLFLFRRGRKFPYDGPRDETGIIEYMKEQIRSPSIEVTTVKALEKSKSKTDINVVGFFRNEEDWLYDEYLAAANEKRKKIKFLHTFNQDVAAHYKTSVPSLVLFQPETFQSKYEKTKSTFKKEEGKSTDIEKFILKHAIPLVGQRTHQNLWLYEDKYPLVVVYYGVDFGFEYRVQTQLIREEVLKVAKDYKGQITFAVCNEEDFAEELKDLGLDDSGEDVNVGFFKTPKHRYSMEPVEDFNAEELKEFVENVQSGKISPYIKSQPVPKSNKGPVFTVVGSTFEELVTKNNKDVILEIYAPWCPHCQKLEPIYKKLAKKFEEHENLMFAKFDGTSNDFPEQYILEGYPTIYYIPANDKNKPVKYSGGKELNDLVKFVESNAGIVDSKDEL